jgi:hypothetical protein
MKKIISKNTSKSSNVNENITIDAKHGEMINYFQKLNESIPKMKEEIKNLVLEYNNKDYTRLNDLEYIFYRDNLKEKITELKKKINSIENNKEINNYYLDVGTLLHSYYENIETSKNNDNLLIENFEDNLLNYDNSDIDEDNDLDDEINNNEFNDEKDDLKKKNNIDNNSNKKSVIHFFHNRETELNQKIEQNKIDGAIRKLNSITEPLQGSSEKIDDKLDSKIDTKQDTYTSMKISDFVKEESIFKKKNVLEEYLQKIDPNYVSRIKIDIQIYKCPLCNIDMTLFPSDGIQICEQCGTQQNILIESDKPSFKDPPMEVCYFSYKRVNHFNEWLAQFQAKESTEIPDEVYEKILAEIKKERITNLEKLTTRKIRQYLKKIKLNKYYDHAAHILYQINGVQPPTMSKDLEEKLRLMFKEIQSPFMEVCPKTRKNFLNYSYILHKFVELLGLDEYKVNFPLLKDREKLHQTDMIWCKICEKLGWHFIKSI